MPKVSCLIPIHNMQDWISSSVESVQKQTHPVDEILIWDDGSTDGSKAAIEALAAADPKIKTFSSENRGGGKAFEDMIKIATGDFLLLFDKLRQVAPQAYDDAKSRPRRWSKVLAGQGQKVVESFPRLQYIVSYRLKRSRHKIEPNPANV